MKQLPGKNKETNTFRFKSFAERISEIDVRQNSFYRIGHENEELVDEEDETLFAQTIRKWSVLNLTTEYSNFSRKCQGIVTLPQLIYKKDFVRDVLKSALESSSTLSLEPILDVLVAFAKDIREEFYPFFESFFEQLIRLLQTQDSDQLEWTVRCLALLFKSLRPFLKRNIAVVLGQVAPLLDNDTNPDYIVDFASECFSFVARDIKDYAKFLHLTIKYVAKKRSALPGCGKLFFELVRGVGGNFHSVAKDFLAALFGMLASPKHEQDVLLEVISRTVQEILESINTNSITVFWETLGNAVTEMLANANCLPVGALNSAVALIKQSAGWKKGKAIADAGQIVSLLAECVEHIEDEEILLELSATISLILHSDCVKLQQLDASRLIGKMLAVGLPYVYERFVCEMSMHAQFEFQILPHFLVYFENEPNSQKLDLLVQIIQKRSGKRIKHPWRRLPVKLKKVKTINWLERNIKSVGARASPKNDLETGLLSMMLYPHLVGVNNSCVVEALKSQISELEFQDENCGTTATIALIALEALVNLDDDIEANFLNQTLINLLEYASVDLTLLHTLVVVLEYAERTKKSVFTKQNMLQVHKRIAKCLSSHCHEIRTLACKVLSYFSDLPGLQSVYKIFYEIVSVDPTVQTYREQLLLLQKLAPTGQLYNNITMDLVKSDCVNFALGHLYQNFKLLWEPTMKLIEELADKLPVDEFWAVYRGKLEDTNKYIHNEGVLSKEAILPNFKHTALVSVCKESIPDVEKVDFYNYRILLWKNISNFKLISEVKNKDIVGFFLDFVENEYKKTDDDNMLTWNVLKQDPLANTTEKKPAERTGRNSSKRGYLVTATLSAMLEVFGKFANPKQLYREPDIKCFYYELLKGSNEQLQRASLDCLLRYKPKSCVQYKEHLYALLDDKKFKDELINFKLDVESKTIDPDHRPELMPVLLRILYGKMRSNTGNKFISSQMRRSIVLRFLAGCKTDEIFWFLQMAFEGYEGILKEDLECIPSRIESEFKSGEVLSPKKLRSALNLVELLRQQFGGLMDDNFLVYTLKVIILAGSVCRSVFANVEQTNDKYLAVFRNLRSQSFICLVNFFDHFQNFSWNRAHILCVLDVFVWPTLPKLPDECLHSPTPLLKLLIAWSQNVKLYRLLEEKGADERTPIGTIISMLDSEKAAPKIRNAIMDMIERILALEETERRMEMSILAPHIERILAKLVASLNSKGRKRSFGKRELFILSKITGMHLQGSVCDTLLTLILPIATGKARVASTEESTAQLVTTLHNLLLRANKPDDHIRNIMPLFERVTDIGTRKQLCKILAEATPHMKRGPESLEVVADLASRLNAWDRKWVEQPDYEKRLAALRCIREKLEKHEMNMELGLLVIYNCFYFLNHDKDLGLRDNASQCLRALVPGLVALFADNRIEVNYLIQEVMFPLIRRTLRDKNDIIRNEAILLLGEMVRNVPDAHSVLKDLQPLSSKEDAEVDFFENVTHLQLHRHGRALLKFSAHAQGLEKPISVQALTQFVLPLASRYLLTEKFAAKHTLVDAAIEAVGMACRSLPWHQYHAVLKYYLQKMRHCREYQKQCIRVVISVLDGFHFDVCHTMDHAVVSQTSLSKDDTDDDKEDEKEADVLDEDLDSELDVLLPNEERHDGSKDAAQKANLPSLVGKLTPISASVAKQIIQTISTQLIPSLNKSITELSSFESKHKINRKRVNYEREEEESLRVPVALAIAKLLKKLPKEVLDANINALFLKVCTFLKSPLKSVRMLTRDILKKIMATIGADYLPLLLSQMTVLLTRGFQVHVLTVTLHSVLDCLKNELKQHNVEEALQYILNVTLNDIFGNASDEKEVEKIGAVTPEAKPSAKSFLSLQITAQNLPQNCLLDLLIPFKQHLYNAHSKKVLTKLQDCLQNITIGLAENANISPETLLEFIYGIMSESIPDLLLPERKLTEKEKVLLGRSQSDCFIIPPPPTFRSGAVRKAIKSNARANAYVLNEFGLELLQIILRRKKLQSQEHLEPLVPFLKTSLESSHPKTCTLSLKCLTSIWFSGMEIKELMDSMEEVVSQIFKVLHKNFNFGVARKDHNFLLIKSAMKAVKCILSDCDYYSLSSERVVQLLYYINQDVNEAGRQPVAFSLLKSLIGKQMYSKELHETMRKLCEISITSESEYSRNEARSVLLTFASTFHKEKKTEAILKFFIAQLNYEVFAGRWSAAKFIESSIKKYPVEVLNRKAEVIFLGLGTRLVNEDVPECRVLIAQCIEVLVSRLDKSNRQRLFDMAVIFFDGAKPVIREMAASLCSRFVEVEKNEFLPKSIKLLPILEAHLNLDNSNDSGRARRNESFGSEYNEASTQLAKELRAADHCLIQIQNCILKIFSYCPEVLMESSLASVIDKIASESQTLLGYDHEWVRMNSVKILNAILPTILVTPSKGDGAAVKLEETPRQFVLLDPDNGLRSLTLDLCAQMVPGHVDADFASEISKCLLYVANILRSLEHSQQMEPSKINLQWLLRRVQYVIHAEVSKAPKSTVQRQSLFDWFEGIVALLDSEELLSHCHSMIAPLIREISDDDKLVEMKLKQKAIRVTNKIRKKIGDENYDKIRIAAQTNLLMKRAGRKKELAQEKVLDPVRSAKRKTSLKERKKEAKRRKMEVLKGKGVQKKKKRKMLDDIF